MDALNNNLNNFKKINNNEEVTNITSSEININNINNNNNNNIIKNNKNDIKKPRCFVCRKKTKTLIPFYCSYCDNNFCTSHRLPEEHNCKNYNIAKINSFVSNKKKLIHNKIEESKIIKI